MYFGVLFIINNAIGLITPPVGFNAFVVHSSLAGRVPLHDIFAGVWRFLVIEIVVVAALLVAAATAVLGVLVKVLQSLS